MDLSGHHFGPRRFLKPHTERLAAKRYENFDVAPLSPVLGAEVRGIDLRELDDDTFAELQDAFYAFKVLFFMDQGINTQQHVAFAERWGELEDHPFLPAKEGYDQLVSLAKDEETVGVENQWHSDVSWREVPSLGSVLRAVEVPSVGGDTLFADMSAAYEGLPDDIKQRIDGAVAVHDFTQSFGAMMDAETRVERQKEYPPARHPVVRIHPATGAKILYVNRIFTSHIVGMDAAESEALIERLCRETSVPEYQCRFRWQKNSVAFWDNRAVQHYAVSDYWPAKRIMERATIVGERPVGPA
ncbi:MAG: TauD/TfdA family dioxygenase [Myxococcales bacterium]|nr:TauD/TfdA family dioxygenase [Myxococcales bacterium]